MAVRITAKALNGTILTFAHVDTYSVEEGDMIQFIDPKTGVKKQFHASNCEITLLEQGDGK